MKTYHPANHWAAFRAGASTQVGRRCGWVPGSVRKDVTELALEHWPSPEWRRGKTEKDYREWFRKDWAFRREMRDRGYGAIWAVLLSAFISAVINALIKWWLESKETEGQVEL